MIGAGYFGFVLVVAGEAARQNHLHFIARHIFWQVYQALVSVKLNTATLSSSKRAIRSCLGEGFEELVFAQDCGVETAIVPGLSSSYTVPALAGIPLTCRGVSESFWVLTGTTKDHQLSADIQVAVRSTATLMILMGIKHLPEIVDALADAGRADVPMAIVQNGSCADERMAMAPARGMLAGCGGPAANKSGHCCGGRRC